MTKRPLRILFDAHPLVGQKTGVGYYETSLLLELARQHPKDLELVGYYYDLLLLKKVSGLPSAPNIRYRRIAWIPGKLVNLLRRFGISLPIELLTGMKADFILYPNYLGHTSLFKTSSASTIHDLTFVDLPESGSKRNMHDLQQFMPTQIKRSSFIVTVSEFSKQRIHQEFSVPLEQILVTPIPPEIPPKQNDRTQQRLLKKLGVPGKFILTLGTIEPRKNVPNMIEAYLQLPENLQQEYTFVITGKIGWNCEREVALLEQMKREGRNILHAGYVDEPTRAALFHGATLFTWASHYEGFGMPILEAMSCGTPCAISDIPVFREVAKDTALYFDQNKPAAIAAAWQKLLSDRTLHDRLSKQAQQQADSYHWDTVAKSLYARIVKTVGE